MAKTGQNMVKTRSKPLYGLHSRSGPPRRVKRVNPGSDLKSSCPSGRIRQKGSKGVKNDPFWLFWAMWPKGGPNPCSWGVFWATYGQNDPFLDLPADSSYTFILDLWDYLAPQRVTIPSGTHFGPSHLGRPGVRTEFESLFPN